MSVCVSVCLSVCPREKVEYLLMERMDLFDSCGQLEMTNVGLTRSNLNSMEGRVRRGSIDLSNMKAGCDPEIYLRELCKNVPTHTLRRTK